MDLSKAIQKVKAGRQDAFRLVVEQFQEYAFRLAFKIVCNEDDAKDVVQESFVKVWQHISDYKPSVKFSTWLYKIVSNTAIDAYRKNQRRKTSSSYEVDGLITELAFDNPGTLLANKELSMILNKLATELPEKQRLAFILRDLEGLESREVQQIMNASEDIVKSNLYHARKAIREYLVKQGIFERR